MKKQMKLEICELLVMCKNIILVDDMVDTAGTLTKAADMMINRGPYH